MEERNTAMMNPVDSIADLLPDSSSSASRSHQPSDGFSKVLSCGQITNVEDESHNKKKKNKKCSELKEMAGSDDIFSDNCKDDESNYKTGGLHCHQDHQRRMSLTSLVSVKPPTSHNAPARRRTIDLGRGSDLIYIQRLLPFQKSWTFFDYLDKHIPWTRPTIRVFGRSCLQPRDTCYVASSGLTPLIYSGYRPDAYSWDDFPPLKEILDAIYEALPGSRFNSLLLNRYKGANDYVGWHADDEKLYGPTPEIASLSFGCERDFVLKKKKLEEDDGLDKKRLKKSISGDDQQSFTLKHGSLLVMRGYTQRDWIHSVPKRAKAEGTRINLTFRLVL